MSGHGGQTTAPPPVNGPPVKELEKLSLVTPAPPLMVPLVPSAAKKVRTPARSGYGSVGRKVLIKANHFLVGVGSRDPHQYDVSPSFFFLCLHSLCVFLHLHCVYFFFFFNNICEIHSVLSVCFLHFLLCSICLTMCVYTVTVCLCSFFFLNCVWVT